MIKEVYIEKGQTMFDLALMQYGSIEGMFSLIRDNENLNSVNDNVFPGDKIIINDDDVINQSIIDFYSSNELVLVSGIFPESALFNEDFNNDFDNIQASGLIGGSFNISFNLSFL